MRRVDYWLLLLLTLLALALRVYRLDYPNSRVFDELYYVKAANNYIAGEPDSNPYHPPMGKILIALGMKVAAPLGESFSWRFASLIFGTLMIPLTYLLAFQISKKTGVAALAALFLALDFLHLVQSRIAMLDIFTAFFNLLGFLFLWLYLERRKPGSFLLFSISFGLAVVCKWSGIFAAIGAVICLFVIPREGEKRPLRETWLMGLILLTVYLLGHLPWALNGTGVKTIFTYHYQMFHFRFLEKFQHGYLSYVWQWPTLIRPIWYYYKELGKKVHGIIATGSPLFWWGFLLAWPTLIYRAIKSDRPEYRFLVIAYFSQYIFWLIAFRGGFFYYILPSVPQMAILMALLIYDYYRQGAFWQRAVLICFVVGIAVVFALYYPLLTALPVSKAYYDRLIPFRNWI